jgi:hypothetical protein
LPVLVTGTPAFSRSAAGENQSRLLAGSLLRGLKPGPQPRDHFTSCNICELRTIRAKHFSIWTHGMDSSWASVKAFALRISGRKVQLSEIALQTALHLLKDTDANALVGTVNDGDFAFSATRKQSKL